MMLSPVAACAAGGSAVPEQWLGPVTGIEIAGKAAAHEEDEQLQHFPQKVWQQFVLTEIKGRHMPQL